MDVDSDALNGFSLVLSLDRLMIDCAGMIAEISMHYLYRHFDADPKASPRVFVKLSRPYCG